MKTLNDLLIEWQGTALVIALITDLLMFLALGFLMYLLFKSKNINQNPLAEIVLVLQKFRFRYSVVIILIFINILVFFFPSFNISMNDKHWPILDKTQVFFQSVLLMCLQFYFQKKDEEDVVVIKKKKKKKKEPKIESTE